MHLLVSNTGLQFVRWNWNPQFAQLEAQEKFHYSNLYDSIDRFRWFIQEVHAVTIEDESFMINHLDFEQYEQELADLNIVADPSRLAELKSIFSHINVADCERAGRLENEMNKWVGRWLPIPYVERIAGVDEHMEPRIAPRIFIVPAETGFDCTLCINTSATEVQGSSFNVASKAKSIIRFLDERTQRTGRLDYLESAYYRSTEERDEGKGKALASYVSVIQALAASRSASLEFVIPDNQQIPVDCFIDLGNANSCVVLQEENPVAGGFFGKCASLEMLDLSQPNRSFDGSFPSVVAFQKTTFAENGMLLDGEDFKWPSAMRIGYEAQKIIHDGKGDAIQEDCQAYLSSPKRYLWDDGNSDAEWHYAPTKLDGESSEPVHIPGYTEGGDLLMNGIGSRLAGAFGDEHFGPQLFSKSSLNRFFFIEIFAHAVSQMNSMSFRKRMGNERKMRHLRHVVVSCPTGMLQAEQAALRRYAHQALAYVTNHNGFTGEPVSPGEAPTPVIHPSEKDVLMAMDSLGDRKSWMYDEATCVQMLYMYGTLQHQFNRNVSSFLKSFNAAGPDRIRVGTVDLGGGTCDILVCDHVIGSEGNAVKITPKPLYWDSLMRAGDDLRKELVERILVPNLIDHLRSHSSLTDPAQQLALLIGSETGQYDANQIRFLRSFMQQLALPLTNQYLDRANESDGTYDLDYRDVFGEAGLNEHFLQSFNSKCQCNLEEVKWRIDPQQISEACVQFFELQMKSVSGMLSKLGCDVVLLSGGTFLIRALEEAFQKALGVMVSRTHNLNHWRPGNWHPFTDGAGVMLDTKSHVALGASIALHGAVTRKLPGFELNCDYLKTEIKSTARCIWRIEGGSQVPVMASDENTSAFEGAEPMSLLVSSIDSPNYPTKPAYRIELNEAKFLKNALDQGHPPAEAYQVVTNRCNAIRARGPFTFSLQRNPSEGYESLVISDVRDAEENDIAPSDFRLIGQTLPEKEFWIEKGVFIH